AGRRGGGMKNLRRMSVGLALCIASMLLVIAPAVAQAEDEQPMAVDLELVLAVDVSGSIDEQEATLQRQGYVEAFMHPEVIAAIGYGMLGRIAVTYFEWAGDGWQIPVANWTVIGS